MNAKQILGFISAAILITLGGFMIEARANAYKAGMNRVEFTSEGERIVGTLFLPANYQQGDKLPVIVVEGPWTQVKEQVGYRYAQKFAENGFAALAFDSRFWGESGGEPRFFESPKAKVADLKAAVNYLKTVSAVDVNRIGGLGVCFGASYIMMTAAEDKDLKSVATVAAWLHDPESIKKLYGEERFNQYWQDGQRALKDYRENKKIDYVPAASTTDSHAAMFLINTSGSGDYYVSEKRGVIPQWTNRFAQMAWIDWLNLDAINSVAPRLTQPLLMIHSDNSALPDNVRRFYSLVKSPKELYWTTGNHLDFYDREKEVNDAVQALVRHFNKTMPPANGAVNK